MGERLSIREWPAGERPRELLLRYGPRELSDATLIAILLRTGVPGSSAIDLARDLLRKAGSLHALASSLPENIVQFGLGEVRSCALIAAFEIGRRVEVSRRGSRPCLNSPEDVVSVFGPKLRTLRHEEFWVALLSSSNELESDVRISSGTLNASLAHPRECFSQAVQRKAASVIFIHNHPSGNPSPSPEDVTLTRQLVEAGKILGIPVQDHIIIAGNAYLSFAEEHLL